MEVIQCPHCLFEHENWQDYGLDGAEMEGKFEMTCENCSKPFSVEFKMTFDFKTTIDKVIETTSVSSFSKANNYYCTTEDCYYQTNCNSEQEASEQLTKDGGFDIDKKTLCPMCNEDSLIFLYPYEKLPKP